MADGEEEEQRGAGGRRAAQGRALERGGTPPVPAGVKGDFWGGGGGGVTMFWVTNGSGCESSNTKSWIVSAIPPCLASERVLSAATAG